MSRAPCSRPADCWTWITPDDVIGHALAAFYAACRQVEPPPGQPWMDAAGSWSDRESFLGELSLHFTQRVNAQAVAAGIGKPGSEGPALPPGMVWPEPQQVPA